jgi:hypothetical protein
MYSGSDAEHLLKIVLQRQEAVRDQARNEGEAMCVSRFSHGTRLTAFKLWRLHVMVWFEDARGAR